MLLSYQWLMEYLPEPLPLEDLENILTSTGLEVEGMETGSSHRAKLQHVVVGEVLTCQPHPNADKLRCTTVEVGQGVVLPIVCGAPNVAAGQKVMVAQVGSVLHPTSGEPFSIKQAKIRGEESRGMICAEDEIGMGESHDGIIVLPPDSQVGMAAADFYHLEEPDTTIEIGLTPNRSDANSHLGVAREIMAWRRYHLGDTRGVLIPPAPSISSYNDNPLEVQVLDDAYCPRYMGIFLEGIHVTESPKWLKDRLQAIGQRPINVVVDITNYVLHEYGTPLHAFDGDKIAEQKVIVRRAKAGEQLTTLDNVPRTLHEDDLLICDGEKPMCLAGVMGGVHSGVTEQTTSIFLEAACFDKDVIRKTSLRHQLRSDAATHFEKGISISLIETALQRAVSLLQEYAQAIVGGDVVDIYPNPKPAPQITCGYSYFEKLSGLKLDHPKILSLLSSLGFTIKSEDAKGFTAIVPDYKTDIHGPEDLVEEIIRVHGLDNIPLHQQLQVPLLPHQQMGSRLQKEKLSNYLVAQGFQEIVTNSITNASYYQDRSDVVCMLNNLNADLNAMRPAMLESGLEVIAYNLNRKNSVLRLFEIGHTYHQAAAQNYQQQEVLSVWITGANEKHHWNTKMEEPNFYFLKGLMQHLATLSGIKGLQMQQGIPWQSAITATQGKQPIFTCTEVSQAQLNKFGIKSPVWYGELQLSIINKQSQQTKIVYKEVPKYPSVQRDLALIVDKEITFESIEQLTQKMKNQRLQSFQLFDVFEHEKLGPGKKSLAMSYVFQDPAGTLTDAEIDTMMQELTQRYQQELNAQIRT